MLVVRVFDQPTSTEFKKMIDISTSCANYLLTSRTCAPQNFEIHLFYQKLKLRCPENLKFQHILLFSFLVLLVSFDPATYSVEEGNTTEKVNVVVTGAFEKQLHLR